MVPVICIRDLMLEGQQHPFNLELLPGMQILCVTADDRQRHHLLQLCTGITLPLEGKVLLDGVDTASLSRHQLLKKRRQFGIVTASGGLIANLKLWENIVLPFHYGHQPVTPEVEQQALTLLDTFGYRGSLMALPGHLSGFERRAAAFTRAAITTPRIMLYAGCFDNLNTAQSALLCEQAQLLHRSIPGLTTLYLTSSTPPQGLHPDACYDLKRHVTPPEGPA